MTLRKGGARRERPSDFWTTYVEVGRVGCIEHYRTHRTVVERWADEVGKAELRKARADYVAECKQRARPVPDRIPERVCPDPAIDSDELAAACQYLRENRNGGWRVGLRDDGRYFVGASTCQPADVIARAVAKGMDEWYVEADIMKRFRESDGVDEWVLDQEVQG